MALLPKAGWSFSLSILCSSLKDRLGQPAGIQWYIHTLIDIFFVSSG
jgi:hypothetical protein